jgi:hypothetical protein
MNDVSRKMLFIKSQVDGMNNYLGIAILFSLFICGITLSMGVCMIAEQLGMKFILSKSIKYL